MPIECVIVHNIPGRVRLRVNQRGIVRSFANKLRSHLLTCSGAVSARINEHCNSVVIVYDPAALTPERIAAGLSDFLSACVGAPVATGNREQTVSGGRESTSVAEMATLSRVRETLTSAHHLLLRKRGSSRRSGNSTVDVLESPGGETSLLPAGDYRLVVGVYDWRDGQRLPASGDNVEAENVVNIAQICVR